MDYVERTEDAAGAEAVGEFWRRVRAVSDFAVDYEADCGMLASGERERLKREFTWYVPLRGFAAGAMEDELSYLTGRHGDGLGSTVMRARGRRSEADDPMAQLAAMGLTAIGHGERNEMNQMYLRMVEDYLAKAGPKNNEGLAVVRSWAVRVPDAEGGWRWEYRMPDFSREGMTGEEVAAELERFESEMWELKGKGMARETDRSVRGLAWPKRFLDEAHRSEHVVPVKMNGVYKYVVSVKSPEVARIMAGRLNDTESLLHKPLRGMQALFTSYSLTFALRNAIRDAGFALNNVTTKESPEYAARFARNMARGHWHTARLLLRYRKGVEETAEDRLFKSFMLDGGKTGYVSSKTVDDLRRDYERMVRQGNRSAAAEWARRWLSPLEGVRLLNEILENHARWSAYRTSREMMRSGRQAVADAKNVSVNFNTVGAGGAVAETARTLNGRVAGTVGHVMRNGFMFFNAGIQDLAILGSNIMRHPVRTAALTFGVPFAMGAAVVPAVMALLGLDDDYWEIPDFERRNNLCVPVGVHRHSRMYRITDIYSVHGSGDVPVPGKGAYQCCGEASSKSSHFDSMLNRSSRITCILVMFLVGNPYHSRVPLGVSAAP